ncbi:Extragenic suppressor of kinetochore protein 1 [Cytospora mali]|uniref:Extragenic suppressor of kinetochore protein 1 n=1 Tax=Cytospora mali TaxID=578113 RepID=A0A194UP16_CYTMA|nr:Extragenic suppressor of kinetochore protein 1 [Valsa mali var. pyri (nom. inval.)]
MFWRFGGYANISTIDTILDKNDFTLEELLEESDLIQELKQHNAKLIDYLRDEPVLVKLLEYVVAPRLEPVASPDADDDEDPEKAKSRGLSFSRPRSSSRASEPENKEEEMEKKRNRYAYVAAEILSSDNWSICEALLSNKAMLRNFWDFLKRPTPLDPLQAGYFTKVNEALFDKKTEEMVELLKSIDNAVPDMLRHVDCPMIMDLLLKIISLERTEAGQGIVEWLYTQDVMPTLLSFLGPAHSWATQTSAGDFMKAIITVSANASQNEQTCIGPNELTRQLVSKQCVEQLISYMLSGGNALTVGVGIVIEVIRKNNSDYDPDVGAESNSLPSSRDPIYLGTLLRMFAVHVPDFMSLIMNAPAQKARLSSTFGDKIEPLGFDRFKTCELMAELLHCSNMGLLNEVGSEELIATRDAERHRLRLEGKLSAMRGEEGPASTDDLTMRIPHSSPADEGRRLEITNISEDDGFEEVAHSTEMTEDTSHEFVKAEEEILQTGPATSFLDKDEDDFVDEPLSSPRLKVNEAANEEPKFEDPALVVAPLSPSKQKAAELRQLPPPASEDEVSKVEDLVDDMQKSILDDKPTTPEPKDATASAEESDASTSAVDTPADSSIAESESAKAEADAEAASAPGSTDTQAEDAAKPAPLFSQHQTAQEETAAAAEEAKDTSEAAQVAEDVSKFESANQSAEADQSQQGPGDASIIVGHEGQPDAQDLSNVQPVVGDFLKMQFVEYEVVPTILTFFFKYPWNNFLHNVVYDIVQQVFNGPMDRGFNPTLAISLFESADITSQIINGQHASEQSQQQNKTRMGFMGHLTLIAEEVVKFTERHPPELLSETVLQKVMDQDWINYVEGALAETRERDNAILGGVRPEVAMSNRQAGGLAAVGLSSLGAAFGSSQGGGSSALADAGLNGGLSDVGEGSGGNVDHSDEFEDVSLDDNSDVDSLGHLLPDDWEEIEGGATGPVQQVADGANEASGVADQVDDDTDRLLNLLMSVNFAEEEELQQRRAQRDSEIYEGMLRLLRDLFEDRHPAAFVDRMADILSCPPTSPPSEHDLRVQACLLEIGQVIQERSQQDFRAYTDPLNTSNQSPSDSLNPPSIPPPPPPPPPLNIPPSRARMAFAARLASKRKEAEEAGEEGEVNEEKGLGKGGMSGLMQTKDRDDDGNWNRGGWWRGALGSKKKTPPKPETFGDGRDSDSDQEEEGRGGAGTSSDEEFGDFAMPESSATPSTEAGGSGIDAEREKVLVKPLPVHPSGSGGGNKSGNFLGLWPFAKKDKDSSSSGKEEEQAEKKEEGGNEDAAAAVETEKPIEAQAAEEVVKEENDKEAAAVEEAKTAGVDEHPVVLSEDGEKVQPTKEAKRRTSIEEPDEGDEVVV